jgi:hypothetical protein
VIPVSTLAGGMNCRRVLSQGGRKGGDTEGLQGLWEAGRPGQGDLRREREEVREREWD